MLYTQLVQKAVASFERKLPFVLYSFPGDSLVKAAFQKTSEHFVTSDFSEESFVMAPFNLGDSVLQIPFSQATKCEAALPKLNHVSVSDVSVSETSEDREKHMALVAKAVSKIKTGSAQKIVVSRCKKIKLPNFDVASLCKSLFSQYPDAFRYVWFHPDTDIWCGATPEVLLETKALNFNTMALAGTQRIDDKMMIQWSTKEKREQKWVADAIIESLETKTAVLKVSKTQTHIAGNLAHLKTDISGVLNSSRVTLSDIANALHPTPAICGTPRNVAMRFIKQNEGYERTYYAGFLGAVCEAQQCSKLFVNLRSLSIKNGEASLYAGGGITIDSQPLAEWEETHNKLETMAKVLQPLL